MTDVIQSGKSDAQRVADRLKPSAGSPDTASTQVTHGTGPTRVVHTIHHGSSQKAITADKALTKAGWNGRAFSIPKLHSTMQGSSWRFVTGAVMRMYEVFSSGRDSFGDGMGHSGE
jgi:hypothetical protein